MVCYGAVLFLPMLLLLGLAHWTITLLDEWRLLRGGIPLTRTGFVLHYDVAAALLLAIFPVAAAIWGLVRLRSGLLAVRFASA